MLPVHSALPLSTDLPEDIDVSDVVADVSDDGVSAPSDEASELAAVVDRAAEHGIKLSIVVLDEDPGRDSQLRDLATEVGTEEGGTVLVLSPSWSAHTAIRSAGSCSNRVRTAPTPAMRWSPRITSSTK